jgi:predicted DNA-binding protein
MAGRSPRVPGCSSTCVVHVRVTAVERAHLAAVAREVQRPVAEVIREAVNEYVADYRDDLVFVTRNGRVGVGSS